MGSRVSLDFDLEDRDLAQEISTGLHAQNLNEIIPHPNVNQT